MRYVLAYDLGTSSIKASVVNSCATAVVSASCDYPTYSLEKGRREQSPDDWINAMKEATEKLFAKFDKKELIECIAISGHSLGAIPLDKNGNVLTKRVPIWSDGRASEQADRFFSAVDYKLWYKKTGNGFTRHLYSVFKMMWLKDNFPEIYENTCVFCGTKDYLNYILTGVICTDRSYASGSGVFDLEGDCYDSFYIETAGLRQTDFPQVVSSYKIIGHLTQEASEMLGLARAVSVVAGGVDNACMSLGAGCIGYGDAYVSLGTSAWITVADNNPKTDFKRKIYTWAHCIPGMYLPSSGIFSACSSQEWVINNFFSDLNPSTRYRDFDELASASSAGADGVFFCPVMAGGAYIDVSTAMKGGFMNIDLGTKRCSIARSVLEGIAYEMKLALRALQDVCEIGDTIPFVGGGAVSNVWRQVFADIFNKKVLRGKSLRNAASIGAASLALMAIGAWSNFDLLHEKNPDALNIPNASDVCLYEKQFDTFMKACLAHATVTQSNHH